MWTRATKPDHDIVTDMDTKIPVIVTSLSNAGRVGQPPCSTPFSAARERAPARESTFAKDLQTSSRPVDWRHRHHKARREAKTRPKARRREQGTEVELELRPLRHNTTKGAF